MEFYGACALSRHTTCIVIRSRKCAMVDNCITCTLTCHHAKSAITRCHWNWYLAYEHSIQTFITEASQDISRRPGIWNIIHTMIRRSCTTLNPRLNTYMEQQNQHAGSTMYAFHSTWKDFQVQETKRFMGLQCLWYLASLTIRGYALL